MGNRVSECICRSEEEKRYTEETGYVRLIHFEPGYDSDGNPCPVHDPRKKKNMSEQANSTNEARERRGKELRALVVSWNEQKSFLLALNEQELAIEEGKFAPNEDWSIMADEILGAFMSQPKMTAWDEKPEEKQDDGPKLILPQ